ncbi:MAG: hypothetical protein LBG52_01845 [Candidatus Peribacteria bacterium]|nr:hypothetical protein [Candidatus Peribacteria bacterium]
MRKQLSPKFELISIFECYPEVRYMRYSFEYSPYEDTKYYRVDQVDDRDLANKMIDNEQAPIPDYWLDVADRLRYCHLRFKYKNLSLDICKIYEYDSRFHIDGYDSKETFMEECPELYEMIKTLTPVDRGCRFEYEGIENLYQVIKFANAWAEWAEIG